MLANAALLLLVAAVGMPGGIVKSEDLFTTGLSQLPWSSGRWACYRIPAIMRAGNGTLLAFAAERLSSPVAKSCSDGDAVNLVVRRSADSGVTWGPVEFVFSPGTSTNAWPVYDPATNEISLFTNVNTAGCHCDVQVLTSKDNGVTWSKPTVLPKDKAQGSGLTHGVAMSEKAKGPVGRLVTCVRKICLNSCPEDYHSSVVFSDDHGASWQQSDWLTAGTTECQVAELPSGDLYMTSRPYIGWKGQKNVRLAAWSADGGSTWGPVTGVPDLIDNGFACEGSITTDPANNKVYFVHPDSTGRSNLTLYTSSGNATAWRPAVQLYSGGAEYSDAVVVNPSPVGAGDKVGVLYEADNCARMVFALVQL